VLEEALARYRRWMAASAKWWRCASSPTCPRMRSPKCWAFRARTVNYEWRMARLALQGGIRMTAELWQRVKSLFDRVLDQPAPARDVFLTEAVRAPSSRLESGS